MSIGTFILIKNEAEWVGPHVMSVLPFVDQMVFFDGNSVDGTIEILEYIKATNKDGNKIKLFKDKDPKNLQADYVKMFNDCMWSLDTDLAWFLHPDMFVLNPTHIEKVKKSDAVALFTHLDSFGGDPEGDLFRFKKGRCPSWKNIYRLRNPDLGAHYHGFYGSAGEDVYFKEITGDSYEHFGDNYSEYPYEVVNSGLFAHHYSDVRPYARRLERMETSLINQGYGENEAKDLAPKHPRVCLKDNGLLNFEFEKAEYPKSFLKWDEEFKDFRKHLKLAGAK